jgi:uncharacterized FAD-dependent dehydrogenase
MKRAFQNSQNIQHMLNTAKNQSTIVKTPIAQPEPVSEPTKQYKKIVIVGAGVASINAATKLVDNGYPGEYITIIDKGNDPINRLPEEVMTGMLGAGGWSDGKLVVSTVQGGQLSKYCGKEKAMSLMNEVVANFTRFHPKPEDISCSDPKEEPDFIKPYFDLRMSLVWHIGSNYLHEIAKNWYSYLLDKGVKFIWNTEVSGVDFKGEYVDLKNSLEVISYDELIFAVGKSGIDFAQALSDQYKLPTEAKAVQIGVRFEAPQKYFQKLIDVSYDFKLYQKHDNVSIRSFCTNNNAAYVAVEETYGNISYNGHAKKGEEFRNDMTNFGILMEIKGIEDPFKWSRDVVQKCQGGQSSKGPTGIFYSPNKDKMVSKTSENEWVMALKVDSLDIFKDAMGEYAEYIINFIADMKKVFKFGNDWGMYIPEVKYLSPEPLVNYTDLSLNEYPNVHFVGDALSARGITVSGAHGLYVAENLLTK